MRPNKKSMFPVASAHFILTTATKFEHSIFSLMILYSQTTQVQKNMLQNDFLV